MTYAYKFSSLILLGCVVLSASPLVSVNGSVSCVPNEGEASQEAISAPGDATCSLGGGSQSHVAVDTSDFELRASAEAWAGFNYPGTLTANLTVHWANTFLMAGGAGSGELTYWLFWMKDTQRIRCAPGLAVDGQAVECGRPISFVYGQPFEVSLDFDWTVGPTTAAMPVEWRMGFVLDDARLQAVAAAEVSALSFDSFERVAEVSNPEPSTLAMLAAALIGILMVRRRR